MTPERGVKHRRWPSIEATSLAYTSATFALPTRVAPFVYHRRQWRCRNLVSAPILACYKTGKAVSETRVFLDLPLIPGSEHRLSLPETAHLRARRILPGTRITLFNNSSSSAVGVLKENGQVLVLQTEEKGCMPVRCVSAVVGLPKIPSRADWAVEKLTELGVASLSFSRSARVVASDPGSTRILRWARLAVAASKQSLRSNVPSVDYCSSFDEIVSRARRANLSLLLSPAGEPLLSSSCVSAIKSASDVLILVGPEGGYTDKEESELVHAGARQVGLGRTRLRVETAVVVAAAVLLQLEYQEQ